MEVEKANKNFDLLEHYPKLWKEFENEIIFKNRFFPKSSDIRKFMDEMSAKFTDFIEIDEMWYRAREMNVSHTESSSFIAYEKNKSAKDMPDKGDLLSLLLAASKSSSNIDTLVNSPWFSAIIQEKNESAEWGYSKDESGMPPANSAGESRANPKFISYLYLANNVDTTLAEVRASKGKYYSVAQYKIVEKLKVLNLCRVNVNEFSDDIADLGKFYLCTSISSAFSSPSRSNDKDYIVSQYLTEYIKTLGFNGIMFESSQNDGGVNLTLFDDFGCEFIMSSIHEVKKILFLSRQLLPFETMEAKI